MQEINELRLDCALKQKRGLHIILASIIIWLVIAIIYFSPMPILMKNLLTFVCAAVLLPLSYFVSKLINVDFQNKDNPLTELGILFSVNQALYLLIAMWIYPTIPEKMLMILAIIFGAHLLPYSWLYKSRVYFTLAILIPFLALIIGLNCEPAILALTMMGIEIVFSLALVWENKEITKN
ncbi:hypothetical protein ERK18_04545 [Lactobacillus kimbladii]|uniref:DUF7010 family protein n=1 Tax=Lactobacillus kimbladii TaxID=1218506 RepID=UPI0016502EAE|nr:hypothetical protein [Lactobacillus kimbladii]MBC6342295.1 hypothetical protein [Lactobacillus kimbladii]